MAIVTIAGTKHVEGPGSICEVELTDLDGLVRVWEFQCSTCGDLATGLSEQEAVEEMAEHRCPQVEACTPDAEL